MCVCVYGVRVIRYDSILCFRFYDYTFVDLIKRNVISPLAVRYGTVKVTVFVIIIMQRLQHHPVLSTEMVRL